MRNCIGKLIPEMTQYSISQYESHKREYTITGKQISTNEVKENKQNEGHEAYEHPIIATWKKHPNETTKTEIVLD